MVGVDAVDGPATAAAPWVVPPPLGTHTPAARGTVTSTLARLTPSDGWGQAALSLDAGRLSVISVSIDLDVPLQDVLNVFELGEPDGSSTDVEIELRDGPTLQLKLDSVTLADLIDRLTRDSQDPASPEGEAVAGDDPSGPAAAEEDRQGPANPESTPPSGGVTTTAPPPYLGPDRTSTSRASDALHSPDEFQAQAACPYCQTPADGELTECPSCRASHHRDCWVEGGGCAMVGCAQDTVSTSTSSPAWQPTPASASPGSGAGHLRPSPSSRSGAATPASLTSVITSPTTTPNPELVSMQRKGRAWPKLVVALLLVGLPIGAVAATANNWFEPIIGRLHTQEDLRNARVAARSDGRTEGYDEGYESGRVEGLEQGYDKGFQEGCVAVFEAADSTVLYDSFSLSYVVPTYVSRSDCYG